MSKPKYLKLIDVVEEDYKTILGGNVNWEIDPANVMSVKLNDGMNTFVHFALEDAKAKSKERSNE